MSHRWDCPTRWEAEREGERAHEYGRGQYSNPYDERNLSSWERDRACPDAERAWDDGYRRAMYRAEEEAEERAAARRLAARQAEEAEAEYEALVQAEQEHYAALEAREARDMAQAETDEDLPF